MSHKNQDTIEYLEGQITTPRLNRIKRVANNRQTDISVVLENVHDPHNIGAVLRSADAIGVSEVFILDTDPRVQNRKLKIGKKTTAGTNRWVKRHYFTDTLDCVKKIRERYNLILSTHLYHNSKSLYDVDFVTEPIALVFGNEHDGVSQELVEMSDGNIRIPQVGMVESLNISVACAVTLYEAFRQKQIAGHYAFGEDSIPLRSDKLDIYREYLEAHVSSKRPS